MHEALGLIPGGGPGLFSLPTLIQTGQIIMLALVTIHCWYINLWVITRYHVHVSVIVCT
jgi:hypothetical protein